MPRRTDDVPVPFFVIQGLGDTQNSAGRGARVCGSGACASEAIHRHRRGHFACFTNPEAFLNVFGSGYSTSADQVAGLQANAATGICKAPQATAGPRIGRSGPGSGMPTSPSAREQEQDAQPAAALAHLLAIGQSGAGDAGIGGDAVPADIHVRPARSDAGRGAALGQIDLEAGQDAQPLLKAQPLRAIRHRRRRRGRCPG